MLQYAAGGTADTLRLERSAFGHGGSNPSRRTNFMNIILTDWPKYKRIEANYRGMETEQLFRKLSEAFHLMMPIESDEGGGYSIFFTEEGIKKELEFRKAHQDKCTVMEKCAGHYK